jgi:hypothetical protein
MQLPLPAKRAGILSSITTPDSVDHAGEFSSLVLDQAGNPVVSYCDYTIDGGVTLKILHCGDPNCSSGGNHPIVSVDTSGQVGEFTSLVLDKAGNPVVSYLDSANYDLKILNCGDPNCANPAGNSITSVDTADRVGFHTSLVIL